MLNGGERSFHRTHYRNGKSNHRARAARARLSSMTILFRLSPVMMLLATGACKPDNPDSSGSAGATRSDSAASARHVLLLTIDTLRWDYLSAHGYDRPTTPFLDRLLARGMVFDRAVTPVPRTTQALASALTGCYPHTTGVRTLGDRLKDHIYSLGQLARYGGYRTVAVVSNQVLGRRRGLDRGFEVYDHATDIRDAAMTTDAAIDHLRFIRPDEKLFLWVHYIDPHVAYDPPKAYADQFDPTYEGRYKDRFGRVRPGMNSPQFPPDLPKPMAVFRNPLSDEVNAHIRRLYAADIRHTDDHARRLVEHLEQRFGDDWTIIFTADHGESLGEHDYYYDHGDYVYQATLHVPLAIILSPSHPLHRIGRSDDWVSLIDIAPTAIELMNLEVPETVDYALAGRSLVPVLRGDALPDRPVFAECGRAFFPKLVQRRTRFNVAGRSRAVISENWKLIWTPDSDSTFDYELYNLAEDPHETRDLFSPSHPRFNPMRTMLEDWLTPVDPRTDQPAELDEKDLDALRGLGYVE